MASARSRGAGSLSGPDAAVLAAERGEEGAVLAWLDGGGRADATYERGEVSGITLLMGAANNGHERVVDMLIRHGAEVNLQSSNGGTALMYAASRGHERVVDLLLQHGAEINLQSSDGFTALMAAAQDGHERVVELLLQRGSEINAQDNDSDTALVRAAGQGHERVVELLLRHGAEINQQDSGGRTALMLAALFNHPAVVRRLLQAGADTAARSANGSKALQLATEKGNTKCVEAFKKHVQEVVAGRPTATAAGGEGAGGASSGGASPAGSRVGKNRVDKASRRGLLKAEPNPATSTACKASTLPVTDHGIMTRSLPDFYGDSSALARQYDDCCRARGRALIKMWDSFNEEFVHGIVPRCQQLCQAGHGSKAVQLVTPWVEKVQWITYGDDREGTLTYHGDKEHPCRVILQNEFVIPVLSLRCSCLANAHEHQSAIRDATDALAFCEFSLSSGMPAKEAVSDQRGSGPDEATVVAGQLQLFHLRGVSYMNVGDYDSAVVDCCAASALCQRHELQFGNRHPQADDVLENTLVTMARQKTGTPRPHYTKQELLKYYEQLGLKNFAPPHYVCSHCSAKPAQGAKLLMCAKCKDAGVATLYCCRDCQKAAWKGGHKHVCGTPPIPRCTLIARPQRGSGMSSKQDIRTHVDDVGYCVLHHHTGPCVVLKDADGGYFESLSDQPVYFDVDGTPTPEELLHFGSIGLNIG